MALLCWARFLVRWVPFKRWRTSLGPGAVGGGTGSVPTGLLRSCRSLAATVDRAASRLPFEIKCLPRAMALSWLLWRRGIGHSFVFAVRPLEQRGSTDSLHAWVEIDGSRIIGDLPGPWVETLRLGS